VRRLNRPLFPDESGQVGGVCQLGFRAGDAEGGDGGDRLAVQVRDVPFDQEYLPVDVRERQVIWSGQDLDGAGGDPAVPFAGGGAGNRHPGPGQRVEGVEQGLPVLFQPRFQLPGRGDLGPLVESAAQDGGRVPGGVVVQRRAGGADVIRPYLWGSITRSGPDAWPV
jgi:hypothetical protein